MTDETKLPPEDNDGRELTDEELNAGPPEPFEHSYWLLTIDFRDPRDRSEWDPECAPPNDDAARTVAWCRDKWFLYDPDITGSIRWTDTRVEISGEVLDAFTELLPWILFHTIPVQVTLSQPLDEEADAEWRKIVKERGYPVRTAADLPPRGERLL